MVGYHWIHDINFMAMSLVTIGTLLSILTTVAMIRECSDNWNFGDMFSEHNWEYTNPPKQQWREKMLVRRYVEIDGRLKIVYDEFTPVNGRSNWSWGGYQHGLQGPEGTEYIYLTEKKQYGFSEKKPPAKPSMIYSAGMEDTVRRIISERGTQG